MKTSSQTVVGIAGAEPIPGYQETPALTAADFSRIRRLAYDHFGLDLRDGKESLVVARLGKELRRKGFSSFRKYVDFVAEDRTGEALTEMVDALTTNFTSFMREPAHFDFLRSILTPKAYQDRELEIWSAACSTGEEPYTILFTLIDALGESARVRVLATDISTRVLRAAEAGVYAKARLEGLPDPWLRKYFLRGDGRWKGSYRVKPEYRKRVKFTRFNLIAGNLPTTRVPVIFCRNVMIYFDRATQEAVVRRLASVLEPGGYLLIGHSETLSGIEHGLTYVRPAVYRMPGKGGTWTKDHS